MTSGTPAYMRAANYPGWEPDWNDPTSEEVERWQLECRTLAAAYGIVEIVPDVQRHLDAFPR